MPERLWKVTGPNGESIHGGSLVWSLPTADGPGERHEVAGDLRICSHGLHLTREPARWWQNGARCFRVEWEECGGEQDDKIVVRRARCVAEVAWDSVSVFESGDHDVRDGFAVLRGNARAVLWGNARADLWDNARADLQRRRIARRAGAVGGSDDGGNLDVPQRRPSIDLGMEL